MNRPQKQISLSKLRAGLFDSVFGPSKGSPPPANSGLPSNPIVWENVVDSATGATYYWNRVTGETTWDVPMEPGSGAKASTQLSTYPAVDDTSFPNLYNAWFSGNYTFKAADGETDRNIIGTNELSQQCIDAINRALADGITRLEVSFPPVPNLEEVDFGTALNQQFSNEIRRELGLEDAKHRGAVRRSLVDFANHRWARRLAAAALLPPSGSGGVGAAGRVWVAHCDQASRGDVAATVDAAGRQAWVGRLAGLREGQVAGGDLLVTVNPGPAEEWKEAERKAGPAALVVLNSLSGGWTYELGGPMPGAEQAYYLKRISKGWVFRVYPGPWRAYMETPSGDVELVKSFDRRPLLREVSGLVRDESFRRFAIFNDRYAKGFGGRL